MNYLTLLIPLKSRHYSDYLGAQKSNKDIMKLWQGNGAIGRVYKPGEKASCCRNDISDESALALGLMKIFSAKN